MLTELIDEKKLHDTVSTFWNSPSSEAIQVLYELELIETYDFVQDVVEVHSAWLRLVPVIFLSCFLIPLIHFQ